MGCAASNDTPKQGDVRAFSDDKTQLKQWTYGLVENAKGQGVCACRVPFEINGVEPKTFTQKPPFLHRLVIHNKPSDVYDPLEFATFNQHQGKVDVLVPDEYASEKNSWGPKKDPVIWVEAYLTEYDEGLRSSEVGKQYKVHLMVQHYRANGLGKPELDRLWVPAKCVREFSGKALSQQTFKKYQYKEMGHYAEKEAKTKAESEAKATPVKGGPKHTDCFHPDDIVATKVHNGITRHDYGDGVFR